MAARVSPPRRRPWAVNGVGGRYCEQVQEHLLELYAIAHHRWQAGREIGTNGHVMRHGLAARQHDHFRDEFADAFLLVFGTGFLEQVFVLAGDLVSTDVPSPAHACDE
jgi:hypothetical protein